MMFFFGVLIVIFMGDGIEVWSKIYDEIQFESELMDDKFVGNFEIDSCEVCMVCVKGFMFDQFWFWVKVFIFDEKFCFIYDYKFDFFYYYGVEGGEFWFEGDQDDYKVFIFLKGKYSVVIYGEDENFVGVGLILGFYVLMFSLGYIIVDCFEKIQVIVIKDVMFMCYFFMLFIVFFMFLVGYVYICSECLKMEVLVYYDYIGGGGVGGYVDFYVVIDYMLSGLMGFMVYLSYGEQG